VRDIFSIPKQSAVALGYNGVVLGRKLLYAQPG